MNVKKYAVASFRSRSQLMKCAQQLKQAGIYAEVIQTPQQIALGCALSLKFDESEIPRVTALLRPMRLHAFAGIYTVEQQGAHLRVSGVKNG